MRMFYGINLPEGVKTELYQRARNWDTFKLLRGENYQVTLAFLGEVGEDKVDQLIKIGEETAKQIKAVGFQLDLLTTKRDMLWAVPSHPSQELLALRDKITQALENKGFTEPTELPFLPHVKLGFTDSVGKTQINPKIDFAATSFSLYATEFVPSRGIQKKEIKRFDLLN